MKRTTRALRFVEKVGGNIRKARTAAGLAQDKAGKRVHADAPTFSRIESGKKDLRLSELFEVSRALGTTPAALVSVEGE